VIPKPHNLGFCFFATASTPIVIFVLVFQRRIVAGLTSGAVKG